MEKAKPVSKSSCAIRPAGALGDGPPRGRKNLLLYVDDEYGFAINAVGRAGPQGSVHDHAHPWVLYGVLTQREPRAL